jgi:copper transport protein
MRRSAAVNRVLLALGAAAVVLLAGPALPGSALVPGTASVVLGHSQLVSSSPGSGETVATAPTELRLVFSEPIDPRYTSLDLLDGTGRTLLTGVGAPDPDDPRTLVATIPAGTTLAPDQIFTVDWRALSAADGHTTQGFLTFGVGDATVGASDHHGSVATAGDLHSGHDTGTAAAEIQGKVLAYGGSMLAFGLAILAWLVLRPALGGIPRGAAYGAGIALLAGAAGCLLLLVIGAGSAPTAAGSTVGAGPDVAGFATGSRIGQLLTTRLLVGLIGGLAVLGVARLGQHRAAAAALAIGGSAGLLGLVLTAAGGHAAAYASPVPIAMDVVHMAAGSIWLSGLVMLAALTDFGGKSRLPQGALGLVIPRFSALALVSVVLIALTGIYADWLQTGDLLDFESPYGITLLAKILVFVAALGVGLMNYVDGGRDRGGRFSLSRRLLVELILGVAVLAITANLTSGSPPGPDRPVAIAPAVSTVVSAQPVSLDLLPGRPGPNRIGAGLTKPPVEGTVVELVLQRLDLDQGTSRLVMRPDFSTVDPRFVTDTTFPPGTRWDATVIATDASGQDVARQRFVFAFDQSGLSEGRQAPPFDPGILAALMLLVLGVLGVGYAAAGGVLPRTLPDASRPALVGASLAGVALGLAGLFVGIPR